MKALTAALAMSLSLLLGVGAATADPRQDRGDRGRGGWEASRGEARGQRWGGPPPWAHGRGREGPPPGRGRFIPPPRYAPPPYAAMRGRAYGRPAYARWTRGQYLPPAYRGYVVEDYRRYHLRPPPYGYYWTRVGDDYLLTAAATGLIFEVIGGGPY